MLKRLLKKYPFFLLLLPVFILTHIEREYHRLINYRLVYGEIIWLLILPFIAYGISWVVMRNRRKAALFAMAVLVAYYFFGETKDALKQAWPGSIWQSYIFLLIFFGVSICAAAFLLKRSKTRFEKLFLFLNTVLLFFIVFDLGAILFSPNSQPKSTLTWTPANIDDTAKPDIYYFIFDSYTSSSFLQEKFGFDNSAIDSSLIKKGFKIVQASRSNYNLTPFSMGSIFHLDYLPEADTAHDYFLRRYLPGVRKVYDNPWFPGLQQLGYEIHNHSLFDTRTVPTTVPPFDVWRTSYIYQQHNLAKKADREIGWNFPKWMRLNKYTILDYVDDRDRHDSITLNDIHNTIRAKSAKPKFVYGHLFIPHSPYTFDSAGNEIPPIGLMPLEEDMKAYTQQIVYVNKVMEKLVNDILSSAKRPTVIIIQGDHGYRFSQKDKKQWEFPNFNAFYFSNGDYRWVNDSLTSINTFRVVGNTYFGQNWPILEGRTNFLQYK